jgi:hypothetical protein
MVKFTFVCNFSTCGEMLERGRGDGERGGGKGKEGEVVAESESYS